MKKSTQAVLLSALIVPGAGHFFLKRHVHGALLSTTAVLAFGFIASQAIQQALAVVDKIERGEIALDPATIEHAIQTQNSPAITIAWCVFAACWLIGVLDAFRIGSAADAVQRPTNPVAHS